MHEGHPHRYYTIALSLILGLLAGASTTMAQEETPFLRDRGTGVATSMFGTYVRKGWLPVSLFESYATEIEYAPLEFGVPATRLSRLSARGGCSSRYGSPTTSPSS